MLFYIGSVLLSKSGLFHNRLAETLKTSLYDNMEAKIHSTKKNFFRGATSLHDFAEIMLLCLQC